METGVHCVEQWSSQHAPQDASQSVIDDVLVDPSGPVFVVVEELHEELHPD